MNSIILSATESAAVIDGSKTVVVIPIKPRPYQVGQKVYIREPWMQQPNGNTNYFGQIINNEYAYKASESKQYIEEWKGCWKSAAIMPQEAARTWIEIIGIEAIRVQSLSNTLQKDIVTQTAKFGNKVWDNNMYVWVITFKIAEVK